LYTKTWLNAAVAGADRADPPGRTDRHYDLVVLGSGPAGEKGAAQAAYFGKRVAIVEKEADLGGACANTGTLPSKTLRESALFLSGLRQREIFGVRLAGHSNAIGVGDFMVQKDFVVGRERERIARNLDRHKVDLYKGAGRLVGPHTVRVESTDGAPVELEADVVLVATGSRPHRPPNIPFEDVFVDDSDEVLQLDKIPKTFIVVGGGVIGSEYASVFAALGTTKVTLIEGRDRILSFLDKEIGDGLTAALTRIGIDVIVNDTVEKYERRADGTGVKVTLKSGKVLEADRLLAAAGRAGNTEKLGLAEVGVKLDDRGRIVVDKNYQTSVPHIYAAGDVIGWPSLASTSMEQGRVAMCHAFGFTYKQSMSTVFPYGLYTIPEVSMVGDTEEDARKKGLDIEVGRAYYRDNARGQIINDQEGLLKLIFDARTKKVVGVHILGERATELVHLGQAVLSFGGTIDWFIDAVFNYPTLSEVYKYAAYDGLGRLAKRG
jgi:NAD(P) transhydrogenase